MSGTADAWDSAVSSWANARADIQALVQIGSRAQERGAVDAWSDYDYHLVTSDPGRYRDGAFARELGPCWAHGAQVAFGNAVKVTAVYEGALEADFVILRHLDMVIATLALRFPSTSGLWPRVLRSGTESLRIVAAPGWRVIKGGAPWRERYSRVTALRLALSEAQFRALCGEFWTQVIWAAKKAARGEYRASERALHLVLLENSLRMFQEEALLEGRAARPFARGAEGWLTAGQLEATRIGPGPDRGALLAAIRRIAGEFSASSAAVARRNAWATEPHGEVIAWLAALPLT